jgi:hypothetical protein
LDAKVIAFGAKAKGDLQKTGLVALWVNKGMLSVFGRQKNARAIF